MAQDEVLAGRNDYSWVAISEGVVLLILGLVAIAWPGITVAAFTVAFGLYALVAGIIHGISGIVTIGRGWKAIGEIVVGLLLVGVGAYTLNHPGVAALTLVAIVGLTFLARGVMDIVLALSSDDHRALGIVVGVLGIVAGIIILRYPIGSGLAYVWLLGIYAIVAGPILIARGFDAPRDARLA
jgi:uncharacterized membrane protein HdeD (DUF308 family)